MSSGNGAGPAIDVRSYHGQPVIKQPVWTWEIPTYFFTGGVGGASAGLAYAAGLRGNHVLARRAWAISVGALAASPALLTSDLGQPARFLNMLRMFKVTSPMSVGSWLLVATSGAATLAAADAWTGRLGRLGRAARPAAAVLGLPLSSYTAALVANTAVPVWHEAHRTLPFVFAAGAGLSAGAAAVISTPVEQARPARRLAVAGAACELAANEVMKRRLGGHAEPYAKGWPHHLSNLTRGAVLAGAGLLAARGSRSRAAAAAAGGLLSAGALSARWSIFRAGFDSAADPRYAIGPQRHGIASGARRGAARRAPLG